MSTRKDILYDLLKLEYYSGLNAGRWEQNEYDRLHLMEEWINIIKDMAIGYNIKYNDSNLNYEDEYALDEFFYDLGQKVKNKLINLLKLE